uniref:Diphosphomevalonate decarboxylase n=1 Tax=Lygus hesperus TaxID=30085 RepID=A0A0A9YVU4_LYGHE
MSWHVMRCVHVYNESMSVPLAYTFDAGPHPVLLCPAHILDNVVQFLRHCLQLSIPTTVDASQVPQGTHTALVDELHETYISQQREGPPSVEQLFDRVTCVKTP